jgi:glycosyltransferase involved in cell wall biosynthesis
MTEPKVSICMVTYNHAPFIAQAVESVLEQRADFAYELVIGDDCSTDGTRDILIEYQNRFPERIKLLLWPENLGLRGKNNLMKTLAECKGQYLAFLEGDDYWIDPDKLLKQVALLDAHPECSMCAHNTKVVSTDSKNVLYFYTPPGEKPFSELADVLEGYRWHTSSVLVRNGLFESLPEWSDQFYSLDWLWYLIAAERGKIAYIDQVMSVYRVREGGIWSSLSRAERWRIQWTQYNLLSQHYGPKYRANLWRFLTNCIKLAGREYLEQNIRHCQSTQALQMEAKEFFQLLMSKISASNLLKMRLRRSFYSGFYSAQGFYCYHLHHASAAAKSLILASACDLSWLADKGYWSVMGEYLFGRRIAEFLRQRL